MSKKYHLNDPNLLKNYEIDEKSIFTKFSKVVKKA